MAPPILFNLHDTFEINFLIKMNLLKIFFLFFVLTGISCNKKNADTAVSETPETEIKTAFDWRGANIYFLLTDRFNNGNPDNDVNFGRTKETAVLRGFEGGDLRGITEKIASGYFTDLGINAIWMTPVVEQIHEGTDEGTGFTYPYHGYWAKDWTALDPNFGTREDLSELIAAAHKKGIRILLDAVINHTGPVTGQDPAWPDNWARTGPPCVYTSYETTVSCTLVENLPDIRTESDVEVDLPPQLIQKWKAEGRYQEEMAELDAFFKRTGYPRAPRFYIMKWLADYIEDFGIDGYRVDTVKHTEEYVWEEFRRVCDLAFSDWKENNPEKVLDNSDFYLVGEVYSYDVNSGKFYDFGDKKVNYFNHSFDALINFNLKSDNKRSLEEIFSSYNKVLHSELDGHGTLNYLTSHDDSEPFDKERSKPYESAIRLLLAPGASQVYYGDESARQLIIDGTQGDATLRSFMNWEEIESDKATQNILAHWQKLGRFRNAHPAVGAGLHTMISETPYTFKRILIDGQVNDEVVIALGLEKGPKTIQVGAVFPEDVILRDAYSNKTGIVKEGQIMIDSDYELLLLEKADY